MATPGTEVSADATVRLDLDNELQPDALLRIDPACGGRSQTSHDDYIEGAPELAAEVTASSASYDLHAKLHAYRRSGVQEYVVWRTRDREVDWFVLQGSEYRRLEPDPSGLLKSRVFPGLWLDPAALLADDMSPAMAILQEGLKSQEHPELLKRLSSPRTSSEGSD